jgi:hypothetical protein
MCAWSLLASAVRVWSLLASAMCAWGLLASAIYVCLFGVSFVHWFYWPAQLYVVEPRRTAVRGYW